MVRTTSRGLVGRIVMTDNVQVGFRFPLAFVRRLWFVLSRGSGPGCRGPRRLSVGFSLPSLFCVPPPLPPLLLLFLRNLHVNAL